MKRALFVVLALTTTTGCSLLKKKVPADAGVDAGAVIDAGDTADAGDTVDAGDTTVIEQAPVTPPPSVGGPFQGDYKCGGSLGPMKVSQQGTTVTASHTEGKGAVAYVAQCQADGNKCVGTYHATDTKTMKPKPGGNVTMNRTPKGDLSYKAGTQAATTCKKQP